MPDLWNTKPPLAVWLIVASFKALGVSEFALRLPSMAGAVATLAMAFAFTRRATRSDTAAALAVVLTATSVGFFGPNGVKTAEYDALLTAFTLGYLIVLYDAFHRRRPSRALLLTFALLVAAATMTKGVAGLVPGAGALAYVLLARRLGRVMGDPRYLLCGLLALLPVAAFVVAREAASVGYLTAMLYNDVGGRFGDALDGHGGSLFYYPALIFGSGLFVAGPVAILVPAALIIADRRRRTALTFALCCAVVPLAILSLAATKLPHYAIPVVPWLAIATAIAVDIGWRWLRRTGVGDAWAATAFVLAVGVALTPGLAASADFRYDFLSRYHRYPRAGYGALLAELDARGVRQVTLVEPGIDGGGFTHYTPQIDYYALLARARGMAVAHRLAGVAIPGTVASCDGPSVAALVGRGATRAGYDGCAYVISAPADEARGAGPAANLAL